MANPRRVILLAEDTDDIRFLVKLMLEMKGHPVVEAADGRQVLELVEEVRPALILMDLNMPVMSGWDAARQLRSNHTTQNIPIVGLSAHCREGWHQEALEAGCDDCIQKPIDDTTLDKVLSQYLTPS